MEIVRPMPVSVAFDVFVIVEDTEHHAGTLWCEKGSTKAEYNKWPNVYDFEPVTGRVILRSNSELALKTIALHEIWDGELDLGVFEVGRIDDSGFGSR